MKERKKGIGAVADDVGRVCARLTHNNIALLQASTFFSPFFLSQRTRIARHAYICHTIKRLLWFLFAVEINQDIFAPPSRRVWMSPLSTARFRVHSTAWPLNDFTTPNTHARWRQSFTRENVTQSFSTWNFSSCACSKVDRWMCEGRKTTTTTLATTPRREYNHYCHWS